MMHYISTSLMPEFEAIAWFCILAPAGTPPAAIRKLNVELARVLKLPDVHERLVTQGLDPVGGTPEAFGRFMRSEIDKWRKVIRSAGITAD